MLCVTALASSITAIIILIALPLGLSVDDDELFDSLMLHTFVLMMQVVSGNRRVRWNMNIDAPITPTSKGADYSAITNSLLFGRISSCMRTSA